MKSSSTYDSDVLSMLCKNRMSYIIFSRQYELIEFSKNIPKLADDESRVVCGVDVREAFWAFVGVEREMMTLFDRCEDTIKLPMISKKNIYYDIEIGVIKSPKKQEVFIAYITAKSDLLHKYTEVVQSVNQKTLSHRHEKDRTKSNFDIINEHLITFHIDQQGVLTEANRACQQFLGISENDIIGFHYSEFFYTRSNDITSDSERMLHAKSGMGEEVFFHAVVIPVKRNDIVCESILICQDVTYLKRVEKELEHAADHDYLTGLPNRSLLCKQINAAITEDDHNGSIFGVCFIDLDDFKPVNDTFGHHVGDMLLRHIASILNDFVRKMDTVARFGGDEFVILFRDIKTEEYLQTLVKRVEQLPMKYPFKNGKGITIEFGFSIGCSYYPKHGRNTTVLINYADKAMYKNKKRALEGVKQTV